MRVDPRVDPPASIGWIIPVPPGCAIKEVDTGSLFDDLHDWTHPSSKSIYGLRTGRPTGLNRFNQSIFGSREESNGGLKWNWEILPGTDETALQALIEWTRVRNLNGLVEPSSRVYAERGWTFAVGTTEQPLGEGTLGPVQLTFPSSDLVFPLKYQSGVGEFDLAMYAFSDKVLDSRLTNTHRLRTPRGWTRRHRSAFRGGVPLGETGPPATLTGYLEKVGLNGSAATAADSLSAYIWEGNRLKIRSSSRGRSAKDFVIPEKQARSRSRSSRATGAGSSTTRRGYRR